MPKIACVLMRGGTSRGPYFLASDLPSDPAARDALLLSVMGSGHEMEIDGIGGGFAQTSKVAIVDRSARADADVDYLFAQAGVSERVIDVTPNCGNMLAGVGPFAIEAGLVDAAAPETTLRIFNVNTGKIIEAIVQTPGGRVTYEGDAAIDGVPGTAAPIRLAFLDAAGAKTGRLLPTGNLRDTIQGIEASCIDMAMPIVMLRAEALDLSGYETPAELDRLTATLDRLESIRREAGRIMGMGDVGGRVVPKPVLIARPRAGGTITARYFTPLSCHRSIATTGAICIATACGMPGTVADGIVQPAELGSGIKRITIEHPAGRIAVELELDRDDPTLPRRASLIRTARRLFAGEVYVP